MSAQDQSINFEYGFALRGDRQVERGLDSIIERFAKTGSFADAAALGVEKFGRIFEVGLPLALGAAALGIGIERLYEVGEEAIKTREKIERLTSEPIGEMDTSALESNIGQIGDELEDIGVKHGSVYGKGFADALGVGVKKEWQDLTALGFNLIYAPFKKALTGQQSVAAKSYEEQEDVTPLQKQLRAEFAALDKKNAASIRRLSDREQLSEQLLNLDESTPSGKTASLYFKSNVSADNLQYSKVEKASAQKDFDSFNKSIADGHDLTQEEVQRRVRLMKRLNDSTERLINDQIQANDDQKAINDFTREQAKFRKDEVISSHGRAIGGGGGVFDGRPMSGRMSGIGDGHNSFGAGHAASFGTSTIKTMDALKDFTNGLKEGSSTLKGGINNNVLSSTALF